MVEYEKIGLYRIDIDYVKYLHDKDSQVFYTSQDNYYKKPYLGLIANLNGYKYCIPLTSRKPHHRNWKNVTPHNYIIYEIVKKRELQHGDIYKQLGNTDKYKKILSVLEIRKMIPVKNGLYKYIDFNEIDNSDGYRDLLYKEYNFIKKIKNSILSKAEKLYNDQINTGIIGKCYCNFSILEEAMKNYRVISDAELEVAVTDIKKSTDKQKTK
ncbi:protein AbiQ [Clostridium moniliforme]|uniref:Protein AbiQ n=1 Tax=Clostridium moniliforme TaxID=39489 RepID=A0ABS4F0L4_9CLOT|nr:type III toxin-antitoxin system ToxN/AbiQ family toxin [Clostridium moniliforme]MBP1889788.1 protein AbiQ [Clostridium moniliforme]